MVYNSNQEMTLTKKLLIIILVLAAVLRLIYLVELSGSPFSLHPVLDAQYYVNWAQKLAWGNFRFVPDYQGNPLYPYFLAFIFRFLGANPHLIRLIQHGLGVLTCLLIFRAGREVSTPAVGLLGTFLYACYVPAIFYEGWFLSAALAAFLTAALLAFLLYARGQPDRLNWLPAGILSGILLLARPSLIPVGALFWVFYISRKPGGKPDIKTSSFFLAGLLVVVLSYSFYYYGQEKEWALISPHGGENFYIGNNPEANGASKMPDFARGSPSLQHEDFRKEAVRRSGRELSRVQSSRFWLKRGLIFIFSHPLQFIKLLILKILLFFGGTDLSDNYHLQFFRGDFAVLKIPFSWRALSALSIIGLVIAWKERKKLSLLYIFVCSYILSVVLFFVTSRLRLPLAPVFCLFAAYALNYIGNQFKVKNWYKPALTIISGAVLFILLAWPKGGTPVYPFYISAGEVNFRQGNYARALSYLEKAREETEERFKEINLRNYRLYLSLGQTYLATGESEKAAQAFDRLLEAAVLPPAELNFEIANAYANNGQYDRAIGHYRLALRENLDHFQAWNNLGLSLGKSGKYDEAGRAFQTALKINPFHAPSHANLGNLYIEQEKYQPAEEELEKALKIDPSLVQLHLARSYCLQKLNRISEAEAAAMRCPRSVRLLMEKQSRRKNQL